MPSRLILALVVCAAGAAVAQPGPGAVDTNGDGKVSSAEFVASRRAMLMRLDTNGDDKVSNAEFARQADRLPGDIATRGYPSMGQGGQQSAFPQVDLNGDGALTPAEMDVAARQRFIVLDTNRDGFLTGPEAAELAADPRR